MFPPSPDGGFIEGELGDGRWLKETFRFPPSPDGGFIEGVPLTVSQMRRRRFHHLQMVASLRVESAGPYYRWRDSRFHHLQMVASLRRG